MMLSNKSFDMNSFAAKPSELNPIKIPTRIIGPGRGAVGEREDKFACDEISKPATRLTKADLSQSDLTGLTLGAYDLGKRIGVGGMGLVYEAIHRHLERKVAIKFVQSGHGLNRELEARFIEEVRAVGRLQNEHIVHASDAGAIDGLQFLVTELLEGDDLSTLVQKRGVAPVPAAFEMIRQACLGLSHAHECGFIHRDIKPSNMFLTQQGELKLLDFGLVRQTQGDSSLTAQGCFMGTLDYIAPEQAENASQVNPCCDIYSLGCVLIYLLTGEPPFPDRTHPLPMMKLRGHLTELPSWEQRLGSPIPKEIKSIVNRMVAKNPQQRFASCEEIIHAIGSIANKQSLEEWFLCESPGVQGESHGTSNSSIFRSLRYLAGSRQLISIAAGLIVLAVGIGCILLGLTGIDMNEGKYSTIAAEKNLPGMPASDVSQESMQETSVDTSDSTLSAEVEQAQRIKANRDANKNAFITSVNIPVGQGVFRSQPIKTHKSKIE